MIEVREAPTPIRHAWKGNGKPMWFYDPAIAFRFSTAELVEFHDGLDVFPCRVELSGGQVVIVRAKK